MSASSATTSILSLRYAQALFDLAKERGKLEEVEASLGHLDEMIESSADLGRLMASPIVSRSEQARAVAAVAERAGIDGLTSNFLGVLADKRRLAALPGIVAAFRRTLAEHRGEATAEVVSAAPLGEQELKDLREGVGRFVGKKVQLAASVDPSLMAGIVVRVGSRMIDASLKSKLQHLELSMKGVG